MPAPQDLAAGILCRDDDIASLAGVVEIDLTVPDVNPADDFVQLRGLGGIEGLPKDGRACRGDCISDSGILEYPDGRRKYVE